MLVIASSEGFVSFCFVFQLKYTMKYKVIEKPCFKKTERNKLLLGQIFVM